MSEAKLPILTPYETELLGRAMPFAKEQLAINSRLPGLQDMRIFLACGQSKAEAVLKHVKHILFSNANTGLESPAANTAAPVLKEVNEINKETWEIQIPRTTICTLEELVAHCKIDLAVWEVERWVANKWEMGYKDDDGKAHSKPLYQVKAFLRRKQFSTLVEYAKDNAKQRATIERLKLSIRSEREIATRLAQNHAGYDDLLANFKEFASIFGDMQLPKELFAHPKALVTPAVADGHSEDAVLLLSDTHYGDRIRREDTSGFPEYDLVIAGNRTGYIVKKTKQVLTLHRAMYPLKKLVVWVGGDIGNGDLHDAPVSNELFLPAQVHFAYHMLKFAIEDLLTLTVPDENGNVVVEQIVLLFTVGNHMRMDEKMPTKLQGQRTLDWLIYQFLIERFTNVPKVSIRAEMSPYIFENIRGHRHLFAHGMQVGYKNSPDAQCKSMGSFIDRVRALFDSPEWRRKNKIQGETFERACIGDIHVPVSFPRLLSNGSLNGQNELGVNWVLEPIPAGQQLFGVADKHCETFKYFLECSSVQKEKADMNPYGIFAQEYANRFGR